jgi:hypothetical protein
MRRSGIIAVMALVALALGAGSADAQTQTAPGWWEWAAPLIVGGEAVATQRGRVTVPRRGGDDWIDPRGGQGNARGQQGPPFCRNGQGHPVHGPQWCVQQGFGLGGGAIWERGRWEDVIFRQPRDRRRSAQMDRGGLLDVLGDVVFGRVDNRRRQLGANDPLNGRWYRDSQTGADVLQIRAGGIPIAELTDLTGDGRADLILLNRGQR